MPWTPLTARLPTLPLILCGPIPRRVEPRAVTVWVALKAARSVTLRVYERDASSASGALRVRLSGTRHTVRLGDALHIAAVTARPSDGDAGGDPAQRAQQAAPLEPGVVYYYNLFFGEAGPAEGTTEQDPPESAPSLTTPGVLLGDPDGAREVERLVYPGHPLPGFVLPADDLRHVRLFHGSCRKVHGTGHDALAALDIALGQSADQPLDRPQQLFFTGDQIYADDVAATTLFDIIDLAGTLCAGNAPETLPLVDAPTSRLAPGTRTHAVVDLAHFTSSATANHLLGYAEYGGLYLLSWSGVLWSPTLPTLADIWVAYPETRLADPETLERALLADEAQRKKIEDFRASLPTVRRALANIATYMICDDHDITDDWFLDGAWCQNVLGSALGWRIVRNGLLAYALFQAWGNDLEAFESEEGRTFLAAVDAWRGDETDAHAATINRRLGMPSGFGGTGELEHPAGTLRWHYTVATPRYSVIVLDARTRRTYAAPKAAPGLLAPSAIAEQLAPTGAESTLIVAQTPVLGVDLVERVQTLSSNNYAFDREAWSLDRVIYQQVLKAMAAMQRVVILSGDVHYGFGASLEYWDETTNPPYTAKLVNFVSSSLKNETSGAQKAVLTVAYPELFYLLSRGRLPPVALFAWDLYGGQTQPLHEAIDTIKGHLLHPWWALSRLMDALRSPEALVVPATGWPHNTFADCPPDRRYRLQYLRDACLSSDSESPASSAAVTQELARIRAEHVTPTDVATSLHTLETLQVRDGGQEANQGAQTERGEAQHEDLLHRALAGVRTMAQGAEQVERGVAQRFITALVERRDLWNRAWQADLHIVGDTNLGEIRFAWDTKHTQEAIQYLWWWRPPGGPAPTPATEYRASLEPPAPADAPPLP
jgi:hypothetical protein